MTTAARVLRRDGIATAGVATLMAEAGLTNGAFYAHLESKEALVAGAVVAALTETTATMARKIEAAAPGGALDAVIDHYLNPRHVDHPEKGCAVAALGTELARRSDTTREAIDGAIGRLVATIALALPDNHPDRLRAAEAMFASMVGAIQLARGSRPAVTARILATGTAAVCQLDRATQY